MQKYPWRLYLRPVRWFGAGSTSLIQWTSVPKHYGGRKEPTTGKLFCDLHVCHGMCTLVQVHNTHSYAQSNTTILKGVHIAFKPSTRRSVRSRSAWVSGTLGLQRDPVSNKQKQNNPPKQKSTPHQKVTNSPKLKITSPKQSLPRFSYTLSYYIASLLSNIILPQSSLF